MIKQLLSLSLVIGKFYLAGKVLIWVYEKINNPENIVLNDINKSFKNLPEKRKRFIIAINSKLNVKYNFRQ